MNHDIALLCRALAVLDVSQEAIENFGRLKHEDDEALVFNFSETLFANSPWTVEAESWDPIEILSELADVLERRGVAVEVDEKGGHIELFFPSDGKRLPYDRPNREGEWWYRTLVEDESIHDVVFAFELLLPKGVEIYSLAYFDFSSTPGYAVLGSEQANALRELLKYLFPCVFAKHRPGTLFRKATEPLGEGD